MCGIAGIIHTSKTTDEERIKKMTRAIAHRGPDGEAHWFNADQTVHLGHRRLAIIDLSSAAAQPMHYLDRYTIIHNGEIYNYPEIKKTLQSHGYKFQTASDTEVILAAFDFWDEDCLDHFDGMFAFAIWDQLERELFVARDRFGEKPFYYYVDQHQFIFASEMKAIWAAGIPRIPNLKMLFNYITIGYVDNPAKPEETFYENILKLPAASRMFYSPVNHELIVEKYWEPDQQPISENIDDKSVIERWLELFTESTKRRLRSDVSLGSSLSGGLDSSAIVATIFELEKGSPTRDAFTAIFPGFEKDESAYATRMVNHTSMRHHTIHVTANDMINEWEEFLTFQEEPVSSGSAFAQYKVFQHAKENGVKVLLDGQGADEVLAGYHKYYKWYWQELFLKRNLLKSGELRKAREAGIKEPFGVRNVVASLFPDLASVVLEQQYLAHALGQEDLSREFVKLQSKEAYYTTPEVKSLNGILHFNTFIHGLEELLRYADRNSMAHGREIRLPFLNHELVSFSFSLPARFKINQAWTKWILRKAMEHKLPAEITWRRDKTGFEPPQHQWMLNPTIIEMIREARKKLVNENILRPEVLKKPILSHHAYEKDVYDWRYLTAAYFL